MRAVYYRKMRRKRIRGLIFAICLLFLISLGVFFFLPKLKIKRIEVSGNKEISLGKIKDILSYKNIFLATEERIKADMLKEFPQISELIVSRNLFEREIKISIKEREEFGIVCQIEKPASPTEVGADKIKNCFYIDREGIIFKEAPQTSGSLVILIKDYSNRDYKIGEKIFDTGLISFISEIKDKLLDDIDLRVVDFNISSFPSEDLKVVTNEGWYILFNLQKETADQLTALKAVLDEKIKDARKNLQYVDLRIENRVYYK